jgi:hypothetical protein
MAGAVAAIETSKAVRIRTTVMKGFPGDTAANIGFPAGE